MMWNSKEIAERGIRTIEYAYEDHCENGRIEDTDLNRLAYYAAVIQHHEFAPRSDPHVQDTIVGYFFEKKKEYLVKILELGDVPTMMAQLLEVEQVTKKMLNHYV